MQLHPKSDAIARLHGHPIAGLTWRDQKVALCEHDRIRYCRERGP
jgi:hypothetical protein